jgi:glucose-1-phosphate thymidylyltransferase
MRGIILAGGTGQRLDPLTRITNKHLLPVYDRPMIYYAIEQMAGAGLDKIMIVTGGNHAGEFLRLLGNGSKFGLRHLDYAYQDKPGGIAEALGLADYFAGGEPVVVLLGDNIFEYSIGGAVKRFAADPKGARIVLAKVDNPAAYGVAELRDGALVRLVEKPANPPSSLAVTGIYCYDARVFAIVNSLKPSGRGELEITDVNNRYLQLGELRHEELTGYWADCGESVDMLRRASNLVAERGANKPLP